VGQPTTALRSRQYISATTAEEEKLVGVVTPLTTAVTQRNTNHPGRYVRQSAPGTLQSPDPAVSLLGIFLVYPSIAVYHKETQEKMNAKEPFVDQLDNRPKVTAENLCGSLDNVYNRKCRRPRLILYGCGQSVRPCCIGIIVNFLATMLVAGL
jgi:hypothetical protein